MISNQYHINIKMLVDWFLFGGIAPSIHPLFLSISTPYPILSKVIV